MNTLKANPDQNSKLKAIELWLTNDDFIFDRVTCKLYTSYPCEFLLVKLYKDGSLKSFSDTRLEDFDLENGYQEHDFNHPEIAKELAVMMSKSEDFEDKYDL